MAPLARRLLPWTLLAVVGCGQNPSGPADTNADVEPPHAGVPDCRDHLECALFCDGPDCSQVCVDSAPPAAAAAVRAVLECGAICTSLSPCLVERCFQPLQDCYYPAVGVGTCGATWACFGDCADDQACLHQCLSGASEPAQRLFSTVEICSDDYVVNQCTSPGETCDLEALTGPCRDMLLACVDHDATVVPESLGACQRATGCGYETPDCETVARRIHAGCPTADRAQFYALETCLANATECGACADETKAWQPSSLCLEILGERASGHYP